MPLSKTLKFIVIKALAEDGVKKDLTSFYAINPTTKTKACIVAKEGGVLCGIEFTRFAFKQLDRKINFKAIKKDGDMIKKGDEVAIVKGNSRVILGGERVALNFLSLLSGIATLTEKFVQKTKNTNAKILDTRKTTPTLREIERIAVRIGKGGNHRYSLSTGILVKDNHLKAGKYIKNGEINAKKIYDLILRLRKKIHCNIEIEIENLNEFMPIANAKPDRIMLDNFSLSNLKKAVYLRNKFFPKIKLEASGGITLNNVRKIALSGVNFISIGMLTHSFSSFDFSLEIL